MSENQGSTFVQPAYRWVARMIDIGLWSPFAYMALVSSVLAFDASMVTDNRVMLVISGAVLLALLMIIDAAVGALFGSTPGKYLLRIRVSEKSGEGLTFVRRLMRNLGVATLGFGWYVPIFGWVLMLVQYVVVRKSKQASYDKLMGFTVVKAGPIGVFRGLFCAVFFCLSITVHVFTLQVANTVANPHGWYIGLNSMGEMASEVGQ